MLTTIHKLGYNEQQTRTFAGLVLYLRTDNWDDFSYKTLFHLSVQGPDGVRHHVGDVKIGFVGQPQSTSTQDFFNTGAPALDQRFFSLGQDSDYYKNLSELPSEIRQVTLSSLRDIVNDRQVMELASTQQVFSNSLLRSISLSTVQEQFARILRGGVVLTPFYFGYVKEQSETSARVALEFVVRPESHPPTNIHVLIGRNGIGKTTLLNNMISCLVDRAAEGDVGKFYDLESQNQGANDSYFSSIISVSFSAFDPFTPPSDRIAENDSIRYTYVGLKEIIVNPDGARVAQHKDIEKFTEDFCRSLSTCFSLQKKKERWVAAIECLSSDSNFAEMQLGRLALLPDRNLIEQYARQFFSRMSSGHAVVLLTLTKLVERTEEKTLLLMDEPESHLHPPLLSAFVRALSLLLNDRNGVAIVATHSPVILQEVPKNCVWKLRRTRLTLTAERPEEETFGENVGALTRDVFGLEVTNSGFHYMLKKDVDAGKSYEQILHEYGGQIGFEGRVMLKAMIRGAGRSDSE